MKRVVVLGLSLLGLSHCKVGEKADMLLYNGRIYTANAVDAVHEAMTLKDGLVMATGSYDSLKSQIDATTSVMDLAGQFVMPGLIEGHGHFWGLGESLMNANLMDTRSWQEIIDRIAEKVKQSPSEGWIEGRGWHQEKWKENPGLTVMSYPYHDALSASSPDHPVVLIHASGHALMANQKAMDRAGITPETASPSGGRIIRDAAGKLTGVFEENAMNLILQAMEEDEKKIPQPVQIEIKRQKARLASEACIQYGITSFQDAGSTLEEIRLLKSWCDSGFIQNRMYVMLYNDYEKQLEEIQSIPVPSNERFTAHAVKAYVDGALGSYGAWMLEPYADNHHHTGQNTLSLDHLRNLARLCNSKKLQFCVHGIGDKGNREILNVFEQEMKQPGLRWRIEHAQHVDPADFPRFKQLGVIASVQAVHCTSDAPFVVRRLGETRACESAYAWRSLIDSGARLANGTDCPVESVNPFECLYAAVSRKRLDSGLSFFPEQKMTRLEALRSYTIWNAYAAREEKVKGSLESNKYADFIILDRDLITCRDIDIPTTKVRRVFISGKEIKPK